jgi:hypothetical protein
MLLPEVNKGVLLLFTEVFDPALALGCARSLIPQDIPEIKMHFMQQDFSKNQ